MVIENMIKLLTKAALNVITRGLNDHSELNLLHI